jgi:gliding motility-associated-like protein
MNAIITNKTNASCFASCDGQATILASGGTSPYTYIWNDPNNQTGATASNLCPGTYNVSIQDGKNCFFNIEVTIEGKEDLIIETTSVNAYCETNTGAASVTNIINGTPPFTYQWNTTPLQTSANAQNLAPGAYQVTVTDANGCQKTTTVNVGNTPPATATIASKTDVSCFGGSDGTATVSVSGTGTPPYTYSWVHAPSGNPIGQTGTTATGLAEGSYYVVVTDVNGCVSTSSTFIINQPTQLTSTVTVTDVTCRFECNGIALLLPAGGTTPYSFSWNDPLSQTSNMAVGLCSGSYEGTVTDAMGCQVSQSITIVDPPELSLDIQVSDANCGQSDGQACAIPVGGTPGYQFEWLSGETDNCISGISSGTYGVKVTDALGCIYETYVSVQDIEGPTAVITSQTNVECNSGCNGQATVDMEGGTGNFIVQWDANANNQTNPTAANLCMGMYSVLITDEVGCSASTSVTITQPLQINYNLAVSQPSCFNVQDGEASVSVSGGTAPYAFQWLDGGNNLLGVSNTIANLPFGNYTLIITDDNGCSVIETFTLNNPEPLWGTTSATNISCYDACDGTITATVQNGQAPYSYQWGTSTSSQTGSVAMNLCPGTHQVVATDANGCSVTLTGTVTQPEQLSSTINNYSNISCNGACDGYASAVIQGGTAPYTYSWSSGGSSSQVANNLCPGLITFTVTDANGCSSSSSVTITEPQPLNSFITKNNVSCFDACNGNATIFLSGGTAPYTYQWNDPQFTNTSSVGNLCAGTYTVTVLDDNNCQTQNAVTITQPTGLTINITTTNPNCGESNGFIAAGVGGGVGPYTYQWNDPYTQTSATAVGLQAGCYTLTIDDAQGCVTDTLVCLDNIDGPSITLNNSQNLLCNGDQNGVVDFNVSGGILPYQSITWYQGTTVLPQYAGMTSTADLAGGCYTIEVVDAAGCSNSLTECISESSTLNSAVTSFTHPSCNSGCDGIATVQASGGSGSYSYLWNTGTSPNQATNNGMCAGTYSVTVSDQNGCTSQSNVTLNNPSPIDIGILDLNNPACTGDCTGLVQVTVAGGAGAYNYSWSTGTSSGPLVSNLCAGSHSVTVIDGNGCSANYAVEIQEPTELTLQISTINATCSNANGGATVTASGGAGGYSYNWGGVGNTPNVSTNTGLPPGTYTVFVTDANGCEATGQASITDEPGAVVDSLIFTTPSCNGLSNGTATIYVSGGIAPYTYLWDNGSTAQQGTGLNAGVHCVTVNDQNNCQVSACVTITQPGVVIAIPEAVPSTICHGQETQVWGGASGGTPPYSITWTGGNTSGWEGFGPHNVSPSSTQNYCFQIADFYGCSGPDASGCVTVTVQPPLGIDLPSQVSTCEGEEIDIFAQAAGGNGGPYTFQWNENSPEGPELTAESTDNASMITYTSSGEAWIYVTIEDGCSTPAIDSVLVMIDASPSIDIAVIDSSGCAPFMTNFVAVSNATNPTYLWDFGCNGVTDVQTTSIQTSHTFTQSGVYDICLTVVSGDGCLATYSSSEVIHVFDVPVADFIYSPVEVTILSPTVYFEDKSSGGEIYTWNFGDGNGVSGPMDEEIPDSLSNGGLTQGTFDNPDHLYQEPGLYEVTLTVSNGDCERSIKKMVIVKDEYTFYLPNAFTPNDDGRNDVFYPVGTGIDPSAFMMQIFNRWGELIFETYNYGEQYGWDGTIRNKPAPIDVYVWRIYTRDHLGVDRDYMGHVLLYR